jgi:hypothetical protein
MHEPDRRSAGPFAPAALGRAHLAMRVVPGVLFALFGANPARAAERIPGHPVDRAEGTKPCPKLGGSHAGAGNDFCSSGRQR